MAVLANALAHVAHRGSLAFRAYSVDVGGDQVSDEVVDDGKRQLSLVVILCNPARD